MENNRQLITLFIYLHVSAFFCECQLAGISRGTWEASHLYEKDAHGVTNTAKGELFLKKGLHYETLNYPHKSGQPTLLTKSQAT